MTAPRIQVDETTHLTPEEERAFRAWVKQQGIADADDPRAHYDYRGFWKSGEPHQPGDHFPDTYKQHGHPTFSVESRYSRGSNDGGHWQGEHFIPPDTAQMLGRHLVDSVSRRKP